MKGSVRHIEWRKILEFLAVFLALPTVGFYFAAKQWGPSVLRYPYYFLVTLFVIQAGLSYLQTFAALARKPFPQAPAGHDEPTPVPKTTFIVCAYLPNETEVIEATLLNILDSVKRPKDDLEVILAYNTPTMLDMEQGLVALALEHPELTLANAYESRSKTENLNYALDLASGEMIVLLDADHLVADDCLERAWRWMERGYDVVQGRCRIRNGGRAFIPAMVEVEFEALYGISHYAKSRLFNTALFGGSNGYWRASVLKEVKFREGFLLSWIQQVPGMLE